ncbi:MAG: type B 50S ribosomal protein L31 [Psychrobacter sp.]|nr:type B 50S ribosomal protein L31 [Psychrobacter sp.]
MRKDIHPEYREVLFHDTNADTFFLTRSTAATKATREYEGKEYPYYPLDISSASHPFYTGEQRKSSNEGRVASFNKRFGAFGGRNKKAAEPEAATETPAAE